MKPFERAVTEMTQEACWINDQYQVLVHYHTFPVFGQMAYLSIKRRDREPIHDWRDLQTIKNMLVGEECEGVELYPRESRVVDTSNQYHMFVFTDPKVEFPFGFFDGRFIFDGEHFFRNGKRLSDEEEAYIRSVAPKAVQRAGADP